MALTAEERTRARRKAMTLLEHMDRTEKALSDRLHRAGFSPEAVADAMAYVSSYGYLDDARYAENYISFRMETKSRRKIMQELSGKGVDQETAALAWEKAAEVIEPDEREILKAAVCRKYAPDTELEDKELRRLYGFLTRRGFCFGDISHVLEELHITRKRQEMQAEYEEGCRDLES